MDADRKQPPCSRGWGESSAYFIKHLTAYKVLHMPVLIHPHDSPWPLSQLIRHPDNRSERLVPEIKAEAPDSQGSTPTSPRALSPLGNSRNAL